MNSAIPKSKTARRPVCPICEGVKHQKFETKQGNAALASNDLRITDARYGVTLPLLKCLQCGFLYANHQDVENLDLLYREMEDRSYMQSFEARTIQARRLLSGALKVRPNAKTMLDIGAGIGLLVLEGRKAGLDAVGIEPSRKLVATARNKLGCKLFQGSFPHPAVAKQKYDLVFLVDVIEHVSDPYNILKACRELLSEGGVVVVITPDVKSIAARLFGKRWWHFRLAHVGYFDLTTVELLSERVGFAVAEKSRPCWYLPVSYILQRLEHYLPIGSLNRFVLKNPFLKRFFKMASPLNLRDSWTFYLVRDRTPSKTLTVQEQLKAHIEICRFDHWVKNIFVLPGLALALWGMKTEIDLVLLVKMFAAVFAIGFVASSNYIINELKDARFDRFHPTKCDRPIPNGRVNIRMAYVQWLVFMAIGLTIGTFISYPAVIALTILWVMGLLYNIEPIRTKDRAYLDVISEGINNPLRFLFGWYIVNPATFPSFALLLSYWMVGCYLMALKRLCEYRAFGQRPELVLYRRSFRDYTELSLITSIVFYGCTSMLFFGTFCMRYRLEMIIAYPLVAVVMAIYFRLAFDPQSAVQAPEKLYREKGLMIAVVLCVLLMVSLLIFDLPVLTRVFEFIPFGKR